MPYARLVDPGIPPNGQIEFHVAVDSDERDIAKAAYPVLREHEELGLVLGGRFAGVMTMGTVLPVILTMDNTVRGRSRRSGAGPAEAGRCRCASCGAIAYVLGAGVVNCRLPGHGPMALVPVG